MPTLRELAVMDDTVFELLAASEGEVTPELEVVMESLGLALRDKVDGYVRGIHAEEAKAAAQEGEAEWHKQQAKYLDARAKATTNRAGRLRFLLDWFMRRSGRRVLSGEVYTVQFEGVGGQQALVKKTERWEDVPARFVKVAHSIDWQLVRAGVDAGDPEALAIASLAPRGERLAIR